MHVLKHILVVLFVTWIQLDNSLQCNAVVSSIIPLHSVNWHWGINRNCIQITTQLGWGYYNCENVNKKLEYQKCWMLLMFIVVLHSFFFSWKQSLASVWSIWPVYLTPQLKINGKWWYSYTWITLLCPALLWVKLIPAALTCGSILNQFYGLLLLLRTEGALHRRACWASWITADFFA